MAFSGYYAWVDRLLKQKMANTGLMNHLFIAGQSQSGKTYIMNWLTEWIVQNGYGKVIYLNCNKLNLLEEALTFMFPNIEKADLKKIKRTRQLNPKTRKIEQTKPRGFKVKVYVPISANAPDKLPENFIPFSIPVNDWDEEIFQALYGDQDVTRIKSVYDAQIKFNKKNKNINYADLKNVLSKFRNSETYWQTGYLGAKTIYYSPKAHKRTIESFFGRFQIFNVQGILSSENFQYSLKKLLRKELVDQQTIVVLDTQHIENRSLEYFIISYFMKAVEDILEKEGLKHKIAHKIIFSLDEIRFLFPSFSEHKQNVHIGITDLGQRFLTAGRKSKIEMWLSVQSPSFIPESLLKNIHTKIVTHFKEKKDIEWVAEHFREWTKNLTNDLFKTFEKQMERGDYRFIIMEDKIERVSMQAASKSGWGNKLPRPRLSFYRHKTKNVDGSLSIECKLPLNDYSILKKDNSTGINLGVETTSDMKSAKKELFNEFVKGEGILKARMDKDRHQKEKQEEEAYKKMARDELDLTIKVAAIKKSSPTETIAGISRRLGITRDRVREYLGKAVHEGFIKDENKESIDKIKKEMLENLRKKT